MIGDLLDRLRYKSEGTDIDFKSAQYRFANASDEEKVELLKDILAIANAWRDGPGYILVGFRDARPHPAEVVGITENIDDAKLQQFVNSKVTPKLTFTYEEHLYQDKTVGIIAIPKQNRPFALRQDFARLKRSVAYVRRGSSTDEADLAEVQQMGFHDRGLGVPNVALKLLSGDGKEELESQVDLRFFTVPDDLPDYSSPISPGFEDVMRRSISMERDNHDFWREFATYLKTLGASIRVRFSLVNRSSSQLTNTKLEIGVESIGGSSPVLMEASDLPSMPRRSSDYFPSFHGRVDTKKKLRVVDHPNGDRCEVRLGSLLPSEEGHSDDALVIIPSSVGQLHLRCRILAAELPTPIEIERLIDVQGEQLEANTETLKGFYRRVFAAPL